MKYTEAKQGRIFIIRLEDGEVIHETIEEFAEEKQIRAAVFTIHGGADKGSKVVCGPEHGRDLPVVPIEVLLDDVHEIVGVGTLFPDEDGQPKVHAHISCGREASAKTGCIQRGVKVWYILEVVLVELLDTSAIRKKDVLTGFKLLEP